MAESLTAARAEGATAEFEAEASRLRSRTEKLL